VADTHLERQLRIILEHQKGKKGYETERENRGIGGDRVHFAVASWSANSGVAFVFSAARLHLEADRVVRLRLPSRAKSVR
jgi:hypothetical protein